MWSNLQEQRQALKVGARLCSNSLFFAGRLGAPRVIEQVCYTAWVRYDAIGMRLPKAARKSSQVEEATAWLDSLQLYI